MESPVVTPWSEAISPNDASVCRKFAEEDLAPSLWSNGPYDLYPPHSHAYHKVLYVVFGSITFELPEEGRSLTLLPGDRLDLPPGVVHSARVGEAGVVCMEAQR